MKAVAVGLVAGLLLTACGRGVVVDAVPQATPYEGPLSVEVTAAPEDEDADRSGAAGRVVDCDGPPVGDSVHPPYEDTVSRSPAAALKRELRAPNRGATSGLHEARREADRVLYTFVVDGRVRQAVIVHRGPAVGGDVGWHAESWARCDWAELPPALAEAQGLAVWTDPSGRRLPTSQVSSSRGPEHCGWQDMVFLSLNGGDLNDGESYVEHPDPELYPDYFAVPYAAAGVLPAKTRDTRYERDGRHVWLAPDHSRAYVGTPSSVAVWPRVIQPLGCA
ncbi:hypothetical protein [uncultured Friedmanniella sp.]|uniref:hypothetical protein n=1 Tax=uncultured Friedmanniella sp. TaxID=335381 RepID=UPI0035CACAD5